MAIKFPTEVEINEQNLEKFINLFKEAYTDVISVIDKSTDFQFRRRRAILREIESILESLGVNVREWLEREVQSYYSLGANDAIAQLRAIDAEIKIGYGFDKIHTYAMYALVDDSSDAILESMRGVSRSARRLLDQAVKEEILFKMAKQRITGETRQKIARGVKSILHNEGLSALIDKGGHTWTLDRYADMLVRTKLVEARNRGMMNRVVENGYDLVVVSKHNSDHKECAVWEGKVLSLTGATPGVPTVAQAQAAGLFHPNCKHAMNVLSKNLAEVTKAYDSKTKTYVPTYLLLSQ